ncbi:hypothetical protein [Amycolatopsis sp. NPDC004625]|uniref:hypothetical protein n=1 Tax=Amycolatopsis sp. NPDC004625 TaxID=3154670 RepID=UPI0033ABC701
MRRWVIWSGVLVAVAAAAVGGYLWLRGGNGATNGTSADAATSSSAPPAQPGSSMTEARAQRIERQLVSPDSNDVADVLASSVKAAYVKEPGALLPAGAMMHLDVARAEQAGQDVLRVPATVTGSTPGAWIVLVIRENGEWFVLGTEQP